MAVLTRVEVSYGQTIPVPIDETGRNFRYQRADCTLEATFDPGDDEAAVAGALWKMARRNVQVQLAPSVKQGDAAVAKVWLGLPSETQALLFPTLTAGQRRAVAGAEHGTATVTEADGATRALPVAALDTEAGA